MNRTVLVASAIIAVCAAGAFVASGPSARSGLAHVVSMARGECASDAKRGSVTAQAGTPTGAHDLAMAGCRFSCAAKETFDEQEVVAQPGVSADQLTQCPVSGVVFRVDAERPRVAVAQHDYVVCCDVCAEKLKRDPERFIHV